LPPIFLRYPSEAPLVLLQDFHGVITGATVNHKIFKVGIILIEDALDGFFDVPTMIV
jgi:hypothetical protein